MIVITKDELSEKTRSPIKDRYPNGTKLPLSEVLKATVGQSDNIGCDVLLKLIGGPEKVTGYIRSLGIKDTAIAVTERQMHEKWDTQYQNWTTPQASSLLLKKFYTEKILSGKSFAFLLSLLSDTKTGQNVFLPACLQERPTCTQDRHISRHKRHHRRGQ